MHDTTDQKTIRVIVFREDEMWVAQCVEYDIGAQATDLTTLQRRFNATIAADVEESVRRHNVPFSGIDAAPACYLDMWNAHSQNVTMQKGDVTPTNSPHLEYEMAMCA